MEQYQAQKGKNRQPKGQNLYQDGPGDRGSGQGRAAAPDPASNSKLKDAIAKAKANNVPNDNIDRIIKKAAGEGSGDKYEALQYEGYGPNGIAVIVETLTDNRNRTAGDLRHYFDKFGGNLGQTGCVGFLFNRKGV